MGSPQLKAPANDVAAVPDIAPAARPDPLEPPTTVKPKKPKRRRRHVLLRLFGISLWGWFRLTVLCVLVGLVVMAINFDPRTVEVDVVATANKLANDAMIAGGWLVRNFWQPALAGATVVLPLWVLWRLVSLPFRR
ncbi:MAG: hypothetical protein AAFR41_06660 [Pseudomonadota bacterium]